MAYAQLKELKRRRAILDPESDDALEANLDAVVLTRLLEKIKTLPEV